MILTIAWALTSTFISAYGAESVDLLVSSDVQKCFMQDGARLCTTPVLAAETITFVLESQATGDDRIQLYRGSVTRFLEGSGERFRAELVIEKTLILGKGGRISILATLIREAAPGCSASLQVEVSGISRLNPVTFYGSSVRVGEVELIPVLRFTPPS